jgi:triosephosphate isomerase
MHAHIRSFLSDAYSVEVASEVRILYGGSVKPGNAKDLFANPDIDGGLIGGASLVASDFLAIVAAAE